MYSNQDIIKQYRQADFRHRLSLFLECPALRNEFVRAKSKIGFRESRVIYLLQYGVETLAYDSVHHYRYS